MEKEVDIFVLLIFLKTQEKKNGDLKKKLTFLCAIILIFNIKVASNHQNCRFVLTILFTKKKEKFILLVLTFIYDHNNHQRLEVLILILFFHDFSLQHHVLDYLLGMDHW